MTTLARLSPADDGFFDRIVDGELTPAELRMAIDRLDREPDGWKRCALAFLEAQCWSESVRPMGQAARAADERRTLSLTTPTSSPDNTRRRWIRSPIAAGIVAASFAMGWMGHAARPGAAPEPTDRALAGAIPDTIASRSSLERVRHASTLRPEMIRHAAWQPDETQTLPTLNDVIQAVGRVRVGPESASAEVPILAGPGINEQWLRNQPPPLTEHGQVALQRHGYQVDQSRRLVTTTLPDGRCVTVPIDQVKIRYTGNNPL
jgi:hypothetical protein